MNRAGAVGAILAGLVTIAGACDGAAQRARPGVGAALAQTPPTPASTAWPNEPAGFAPLSDQPWDTVTRPLEGRVGRAIERLQRMLLAQPGSESGWAYLRRASSRDDDIVSDVTAPLSPPRTLRIIFTPDMQRDREPSVHWIGIPGARRIYAGWWMRLSPNWRTSPAGGGKITFLWPPEGNGVIYSNIGGSTPPHRINVATTWPQYGYRFWEPNVATTSVRYGEWYRIEWHVSWESTAGAADGVIQWWVNGVLNGDYRHVRFPSCCIGQFEFAPTLQRPPAAEQFMFVDHTYVSTPGTR